MTKRELLKKLNDIYGKVDNAVTDADQLKTTLKHIREDIEDLPGEDDDIEDDDDNEDESDTPANP